MRVFTFGAKLWKEVSPLLFDMTSVVEGARGFAPPLLVDVTVRGAASGSGSCVGPSFDPVVADRSAVLPCSEEDHSSDAGVHLLDLAVTRASRRQRVIACCSCWVNSTECHRHRVADGLLAAARRAGVDVEIVEWPGGDPRALEIVLPKAEIRRVAAGALSLRVPLPMPEISSLPWGSIVHARPIDETTVTHILSGPAQPGRGELTLPVFAAAEPLSELEVHAVEMLRDFRLSPRTTDDAARSTRFE